MFFMCNITTSLSDSIYVSRLSQQEEGTAAVDDPLFILVPTNKSE